MNDLQKYWNNSSSTIPNDKDPSAYAIEKEKSFPAKAVICDLGGGSGTDSLLFISKGHSVKLLDISDIALSHANEAVQKLGLSNMLKTVQCNLSSGDIPLEDMTCDVVYSRLALHYFEAATLKKLFSEVHRILRVNGTAYITLKSPDDEAEMKYLRNNAAVKDKGVYDEAGYIKTRFTTAQLTSILKSATIAENDFIVTKYVESFEARKDRVKSGKTELLLNEIQITKSL